MLGCQVGPVAAQVPLITVRLRDECGHGFIDGVMNWLDTITPVTLPGAEHPEEWYCHPANPAASH